MKELVKTAVAFSMMIIGGVLIGYGIGASESDAAFERGKRLGDISGRADVLCTILERTTSGKREEQAEEQTLAA